MHKKRGIFFSIDAVIALSLIVVMLIFAFPILKPTSRETEVTKDILLTLSTIKVGEISNAQIQSWISQGLVDANRSILEQIGILSITNLSLGRSLASISLQNLNTKENIGIWYGNNLIYSSNSTSYDSAKNIETERFIVSGIGGLNGSGILSGFSARSFLSNNFRTQYFYFGGYVGDGNLTQTIKYNGTITSAEVELVVNNNFTLYINGLNAGNYNNSPSDTTPAKYNLNTHLPKFSPGINNLDFKGKNIYIAGGYTKITYDSNNTSYQPDTKQYLPGINGVVNLYDGLSIPGQLQSMDISIHHNIPYLSFLTIGNITIWNGSSTNDTTTIIPNAQLISLLNYSALSNKTTPLRFGSENVTLVGNASGGNADVILITDISGSMSATVGGSGTAVVRNCNDPLLYNNNTEKMSLAKCLDEQFVYTILSGNNNQIGLVDFSYNANSYVNLTNNVTLLNNTIKNYAATGTTCISCAINRAYLLLQANSNSSRQKYVIAMTDGVPNQRSTNACYDSQGSGSDPSSLIEGIVGTSGPESRYFGGTWLTQGPTPFSSAQLFNVDFLNSTLGFAVADSYRIFKWNGTGWSLQQDLGSQDLYGINILNGSLGFAVGDSGKIARYNGTAWSEYQDTGNDNFKDVKFINSTLAFAVGNSGKIFRWNGSNTNWYEYQDIGNENLKALDFLNGTYGITVGDTGEIYQWNGTKWPLQQTIPYSLTDVDIVNSTLIFASSSNNNIYKKIGSSAWSGGVYTADGALNTISILNSTLGFAAGSATGGIIIWDGASWNKTYPGFYYQGNSTSGLSCSDLDTCSQYATAPMLNSNYSSCRVNKELNATVHSIGFGDVGTCGFANRTLQAVASCGNGSFFTSDNATQLQQIYANISQNILQLSYAQQTAVVSGNGSGILYSDSYIDVNYTKPSNPFGLTLALENQFQNTTTGNFSVYPNTTLLEARVTSYSGPRWTEKVLFNGAAVYNLNNFNLPYIKLGDPYSIILPKSLILSQNNLGVTTAIGSTNVSAGSQYNKAIYTLTKNFTAFSQVVANAQGCIWNIQFDDGTNLTSPVPSYYAGSNQCYFPPPIGLNTHDPNDALQVAVYNLLREMDLNGNSKIDVKFGEQALKIDTSQINGIPFTWYTEVEVRRWD